MAQIYLLVGVPGSGKSWVCEKLTDKFEYVHHDGYIYLKQPGAYVKAILDIAPKATKPLLCEAPFSVSETQEPLQLAGHKVTPVFIVEQPQVVAERYMKREKKPIPKGHLTRMQTYLRRAIEHGHFFGGSQAVLEYLRSV
jgi:Fe-S cluster assembly ATPase SufC